MTASGVVGHLSGIRIAPGLRSRTAYAAGVRKAKPQGRLVTCSCGTQEDNVVTHRAALAEIDASVDIMYTLLNGGRQGAISACRDRGIAQIGNARDWAVAEPGVFVASSIADTGRLVYRCLDDIACGRLTRGDRSYRGRLTHTGPARRSHAVAWRRLEPDPRRAGRYIILSAKRGRMATFPNFSQSQRRVA